MNNSNKLRKIYFVLSLALITAFIAAAWLFSGQSVQQIQQEIPKPSEQINEPARVTASQTIEALKGSKVMVPGANPISRENKVLTPEGLPVKNNAKSMDPAAPLQTLPVDVKKLAKEVIQIKASSGGFEPQTFTVAKNSPVTFSVTSVDGLTHVMAFMDPSLSAVAMGLAPGETRAMSFNAPSQAGEYFFHCTVPGHEARGEKGVMIVK